MKSLGNLGVYKDAFDPKYLGHPDHVTPTQLEMWPVIRDTWGFKAALIGGKGSAKTTTASAYLIDRAQRYPGSKGFIAASTYQQATDSCAAELVFVAEEMGINVEYFQSKVIDNLPHRHVYYFPDFNSSVCIRSADNMNMIEGSQWDHCAIEEVSFWKELDLSTALSRLRRPVGDNSRLIVGMPAEEDHWMYKYFEDNDFILREISTYENEQNLPPNYIPDLEKMYPGDLGKRYLHGGRVSLHSMPTISKYDPQTHKKGELSQTHTGYDPYRKIIISIDFNVAPCCATIWQIKDIPFDVIRDEQLTTVVKRVLCQIDENEVWSGGTRAVAEQIYAKYGPDLLDHDAGVVIVGDATGNKKDTRNASVTDWSILADVFRGMQDLVVTKGLIINKRKKGSRSNIRRRAEDKMTEPSRYSNPPVKDSIECLNTLHRDGDGHPGILYLPKSEYQSGGASSSVASTKYKADGSIDESPDKEEGKKIRRTHFWATVRYVSWWFAPPHKKGKRRKNTRRSGFRDIKLKDRRVYR